MDTIHYMLDNAGYLASLTFQHRWLVALAVGLAIIIGVPLGVLIVRHKWLAMPVLGAATLLLTIPSIALLAGCRSLMKTDAITVKSLRITSPIISAQAARVGR